MATGDVLFSVPFCVCDVLPYTVLLLVVVLYYLPVLTGSTTVVVVRYNIICQKVSLRLFRFRLSQISPASGSSEDVVVL